MRSLRGQMGSLELTPTPRNAQPISAPLTVKVQAFVLAKNEAANIVKALQALRRLDVPVVVLDSGSTDGTVELAQLVPGVQVEPYKYVDHCTAYNDITLNTSQDSYALILDADMVVSPALWAEIGTVLQQQAPAAVICPIEMWWEGQPMTGGALCPPKAAVLRGGVAHYMASGHGERLMGGHGAHVKVQARLIHDDRKGFEAFIQSQLRYAKSLIDRAERGEVTFKDKVYLYSPLILLLQPLHSYVVRRGFMAGRAGLIYALDRVIAAAIVLRQALARQLANRKP